MISKFKAIFYLQFNFFLTMLGVTLLPFIVIKYLVPEIPNMHIYFIGILVLIRFMLPEGKLNTKGRAKKYLEKRGQFSSQRQVDLISSLSFSKDIFLLATALTIFLIGTN